MNKIAGIILAAGASTRMGRAKQLLQWQGKSLIERSVAIALEAGLWPVVAVLGSRAKQVEKVLETHQVSIAYNKDWESGMGSSVATGLESALQINPDLSAACFLLTDQPYLHSDLIKAMLRVFKEKEVPGVAAAYEDTLGVPALFGKALFPELLALRGKKGAKPLINKYANQLGRVPFPKGGIDLDYPEDWERLKGE